MIGLGLPLVVAAVAALLMAGAHRKARPAAATVALTVGTAAMAAGAVVLVVLYAVAFSLDPHRMAFCRWLLGHHEPHDPTIGIVLALLLAVSALRGWTWWQERRRTLAASLGTGPSTGRRFGVTVLATEEPLAYAHPGRGGHVVLSRGLLAPLTPEERLVVVAHERAHLELRHHRYLAVADLSAAVLPLLRPLARAVRLHSERWADEAAVRTLGGDRRLVASTIARVALASNPAPLPGVAGHVPRRVAWLLEEPTKRRIPTWSVVVAASVVALASLMQAHHLADFVLHVH